MGAGPSWLDFQTLLPSSRERGGRPVGVWNHEIPFLGARVTGRPSCPGRLPTSALTPHHQVPGLSEVGQLHIREPFISHFPEGALWGEGGASVSACICHAVRPQRWAGGGARRAGGPGLLGVRLLTGSVAAADGHRRQRAETSVAHAAGCLQGKASTRHSSRRRRRQRPCLELTVMQAPGRQAGRQTGRWFSWKKPPQSHMAAAQA